jgi:hypothetical protein
LKITYLSKNVSSVFTGGNWHPTIRLNFSKLSLASFPFSSKHNTSLLLSKIVLIGFSGRIPSEIICLLNGS